jgi:hypothetical protein
MNIRIKPSSKQQQRGRTNNNQQFEELKQSSNIQ